MDEQTNTQIEKKNSNKTLLLIPVVIAALIVIAIAGVFALQPQQSTQMTSEAKTVTPTPTSMEEIVVDEESYKDGTYEVVGNYVSPGGPREINVTITLEDGVVTGSTFEGLATDAPSKRFQGEFAEGYEEMVIGKNIDEISLTKVSGSSLTPKGFNDALEKVKAEAKA